MKTRTVFLLALLSLVGSGLWAAESQPQSHGERLAQAFAKDGLVIQTGIDDQGIQNLAVLASNGYFPLQVTARAGVPTVLRVYTNRTYDCSRAFLLPDLKKQAVLPVKGTTAFTLGPQQKGSTLFGTCSMGMYTFQVRFE